MSDYPSKVNSVEYQGKVYKIRDLRFTNGGKAVCNARFSLTTKLDDEWHSVWCELTAWDEAANALADCEHGDEIIIREGRLGANAFRAKNGDVVVEPQVNANVVERLGSGKPKPAPVSTVPDDDSIPF